MFFLKLFSSDRYRYNTIHYIYTVSESDNSDSMDTNPNNIPNRLGGRWCFSINTCISSILGIRILRIAEAKHRLWLLGPSDVIVDVYVRIASASATRTGTTARRI